MEDCRSMALHFTGPTRSGMPQLVDQGLPGLITLLWVKGWYVSEQPPVSLWGNIWGQVWCSRGRSELASEGSLLSEASDLRSAAHFAQLPPSPESLAFPFLRKIPPLQTQQLTELENEWQQWARRQHLPQGHNGLLVSRPHAVPRNVPAAVTPAPNAANSLLMVAIEWHLKEKSASQV